MEKIKTNLDLAHEILDEVRGSGVDTRWLEHIGENIMKPVEIYDVEFDIVGKLMFGSCEGIYFDVYMVGNFDKDGKENGVAPLIYGKCLSTSKESMEMMSKVMANIIFCGTKYLGEHAYEYVRRGFRCYVPGKSSSVWTASEQRAKEYMYMGYTVKNLYTGQEMK